MIAWLEGTLREKTPARCVVVCGGVGYSVAVPASTFARLPAETGRAELFVHTHVREGAIELYGFHSRREREVFELLLDVSGIGPRMAINILSGIPPEELLSALSRGDKARLDVIPGVGKKTAEKILFELRDKASKVGLEGEGVAAASPTTTDVISALVNLGYKRPQAETAARKVLDGSGADRPFDELFRAALQEISR